MKKLPRISLLMGLLFSFNSAIAATFCVSSAAELLAALSSASNNLEDDEIRIKAGTYHNSTGFLFNNSDNRNVTISGGWAGIGPQGCLVQNNSPYTTLFDGFNTGPNLRVNMNNGGDLNINNLSFINGAGNTPNRGVGLRVDGGDELNEVVIERNFFSNNDTTFCSAMCVTTTSMTTIRNNVFADNLVASSTGVINIINYVTGVYFVNNTVVDNTTASVLGNAYSGVQIFVRNAAPAMVANNIFWNNFNGDFLVRDEDSRPSTLYLFNNNYQVAQGTYDVMADNLNEDPLLEGTQIFNFTPSLSSGMRNRGLVMPSNPVNPGFEDLWDHGSTDLIGTSRIQDGRVDIGAREAAPEVPIFNNGFE